MGGHSEGITVKKFCAQRKESCSLHGEKYRKVNSPRKWRGDFRAHHVLCVASVTQYLAKDMDVRKVVRETDWCINRKPNMLAMPPSFGFFKKEYAKWLRAGNKTPPEFDKIPLHSYGHIGEEGYKYEIDTQIVSLAAKVANANKQHENKAAKELAEDLEGLSEHFKEELLRRGEREGGTHAQWHAAFQKGVASQKWYMPFSMADDDSVVEKTFPVRVTKAAVDRVRQLVGAMT